MRGCRGTHGQVLIFQSICVLAGRLEIHSFFRVHKNRTGELVARKRDLRDAWYFFKWQGLSSCLTLKGWLAAVFQCLFNWHIFHGVLFCAIVLRENWRKTARIYRSWFDFYEQIVRRHWFPIIVCWTWINPQNFDSWNSIHWLKTHHPIYSGQKPPIHDLQRTAFSLHKKKL